MGPLLTHWSIRLALVCLVICLADALRRGKWGDANGLRIVWTAGLIFFIAHVTAAFQFYHHWSHREAFQTTAKQTQEMLGVAFGEGIYFSYLFLLVWLADVLWWWLQPESYRRRPWMFSVGLLAYLAFISFNGAVVFEDSITRPVGVIVTLGLAGLMLFRGWQWKQRSPTSESTAA